MRFSVYSIVVLAFVMSASMFGRADAGQIPATASEYFVTGSVHSNLAPCGAFAFVSWNGQFQRLGGGGGRLRLEITLSVQRRVESEN